MQSEIKVRHVELTPEKASQLLRRNTSNRSMSNVRVAQYVTDMRKGFWKFNGEAIKVARDGQVLDGQHRLEAVVESNITIEVLLITGLEPEAQETMDQGRPRSLSDVLKLRGEKDYCTLAAALRLVCIYQRDGIPYKDGAARSPTIHEQLRTLERNPEIRDSVTFALKLHRGGLLSSSVVAGMHNLFSAVSEEDARDFWTKLLRGEDLSSTSPIYVLRDRLLVDLRERLLQPKVKLAFVVRTWNAYQQGEHIQRLMWTAGGANPDRFPAIAGLVDTRVTPELAVVDGGAPESEGGGIRCAA